jgi:hypothetical protein
MINISFTGDVVPAACSCHKGQFVGRVFKIDQGKETLIAHTYFETEALASQHIEDFVFAVAEDTLRQMGLLIDQARKITVERGEKADSAAQAAKNNSNQYLH